MRNRSQNVCTHCKLIMSSWLFPLRSLIILLRHTALDSFIMWSASRWSVFMLNLTPPFQKRSNSSLNSRWSCSTRAARLRPRPFSLSSGLALRNWQWFDECTMCFRLFVRPRRRRESHIVTSRLASHAQDRHSEMYEIEVEILLQPLRRCSSHCVHSPPSSSIRRSSPSAKCSKRCESISISLRLPHVVQ